MNDKAISKAKKRIFEILEAAREGGKSSRAFDIFIIALISLNLAAVILETVKGLSVQYGSLFRNIEVLSVAIFTVEYILRIWTCTANKRFRRPLLGRMRFALTPLPAVDLLAILPFYLPMLIPFDLRFLRVLRLFRIFRMFKIARYSRALKILGNVLKAKREELIIAVFIIIVLLILVSSIIYPENWTEH